MRGLNYGGVLYLNLTGDTSPMGFCMGIQVSRQDMLEKAGKSNWNRRIFQTLIPEGVAILIMRGRCTSLLAKILYTQLSSGRLQDSLVIYEVLEHTPRDR